MTNKLTALETQIEQNGVIEQSWPLESKEGNELKLQLLSHFPEIENFDNVELISYHPRDAITYFDDTISLVYKGSLPDEIADEYDVFYEFSSLDFYAIKYLINQKISILKAYDKTMWQYALPMLPAGCRIHQDFGIGRHFGSDQLTNIYDVYMFHDNDEHLEDMYPSLFPRVPEHKNDKIKGYGITFHGKSLEPLKIKRYLFPDTSHTRYET